MSTTNDAILIRSSNGLWWKDTLGPLVPGVDLVVFGEDDYDPLAITYTVVWDPPIGFFDKLKNLKATISIGAGVSHITKDFNYPKSVPIIRTVGAPLRSRMAEFVSLHVLRVHRKLEDIVTTNKEAQWKQQLTPPAGEVRVGIMGLGNLGGAAARALCALGYNVHGWTRRGRDFEGVTVYPEAHLDRFLSGLNVLVCLLPQTPRTENILNKELFRKLSSGAHLINVGRGEHLVEDDLLSAMASGQIRNATLDVFREEPLDPASRLWKQPGVLVTCHTAAAIDPGVAGEIVAKNLRTLLEGSIPIDVVDLEQGY